MATVAYQQRRGQIEAYFDRTAAEAWSRLTSDAPLGRIRATVRAGRDKMRRTLVSWLPEDLGGRRVLDAGCGTGALAIEAARRGAHVIAVDLSPTLINLAAERAPRDLGTGKIEFRVGDMGDPAFGQFDHAIAMDSLIHYPTGDAIAILAGLASRTSRSVLFTFAPWTPMLAAMHALGRLFPRSDRSPAIEPVAEAAMRRSLSKETRLTDWRPLRTERVTSGFYISQALQLLPK